MKAWMALKRSTTKPRVGNWQLPYEISWLARDSGKIFCRRSVWNRVKDAPAEERVGSYYPLTYNILTTINSSKVNVFSDIQRHRCLTMSKVTFKQGGHPESQQPHLSAGPAPDGHRQHHWCWHPAPLESHKLSEWSWGLFQKTLPERVVNWA